ncbi:MAG TPA: hypothetical protein IAC03_08165 [Candidatus Coprenecus pullistercoris]|nr:hypothetical protein [Candidatus Coprenecus pullistercoris]
MESPFTHNTIATGNNFLSRKKEVSQLLTNIRNGVHTVIYEPPMTGKQSAVYAALSQQEVRPAEIDLLNMVEPSGLMDRLAQTEGHSIIYIKNFQNILRSPDWEKTVSAMSGMMQKDGGPVFIITGSGVNACRHIFEERKMMYRQYERIHLSPIEERSVTEHIIKTFLRVGRVVEQSQAERIYSVADGHPWYIWQIANSCFNLTKGYLSDSLLNEAIDTLLYTHSLRFQETVDGLSRYQIYFLRAVFDGISKASSTEVIDSYRLNSSANVHRIKEALCKKEVILFDADDCPHIIDPVFRLWLERFYFKADNNDSEA